MEDRWDPAASQESTVEARRHRGERSGVFHMIRKNEVESRRRNIRQAMLQEVVTLKDGQNFSRRIRSRLNPLIRTHDDRSYADNFYRFQGKFRLTVCSK